ncbi:MFS transporter [Micromonospora sp. WMMD1155]|uniref:MFS transporter n=1 Tax=Micromonospora sp. WMMD1155 TaxID=3016094 RepID=UPI00249C3F88|nr:MFS transporter [Micromonospora sp. WMMD1155]WFE54852.1 MFS transporter [Micromonospora sp. WMMD1155]
MTEKTKVAVPGRHSVWALGASLSFFGDEMLVLVFAIWIEKLTGSITSAGMVFFAYLVPALLAPATGLLADRRSRTWLLILSDILKTACIPLVLLVHGADDVYILYAIIIVIGICGCLQGAAASALLVNTIASDKLARVNSMFRAGRNVALFAAPAVGAVLYQQSGIALAGAVAAACYLGSAAAVAELRHLETPPSPSGDRFIPELTAGVTYLRANRPVGRIVVLVSVVLLIVGGIDPVLLDVAKDSFGSAASVGWLFSASGIGSVLGGFACVHLSSRTTSLRLLRGGLLVVGVGNLCLIFGERIVALLGCVVMGAGFPAVLVGFYTILQTGSRNEVQGRVFAAADTLRTAAQAASVALVAFLVTRVPYQAVLIGMAIAAAAGAIVLSAGRAPKDEGQTSMMTRPGPGVEGDGAAPAPAGGGA